MPDTAEISVLRRKAEARTGTGLAEMTVAKALRLGFAKAGDEALGVPVGLRDMAEDVATPEGMGVDLPEPALFLRLHGPDGSVGLAIACSQIVAAVIEAKTIGKVLDQKAKDRRPTPTDAMLVGEFLDPGLVGFGALAMGCARPPAVDGFACGKGLVDARAAQMALADVVHRRYRIELDFAGGMKSGKLILFFPADRAAGISGASPAEDWHSTLQNAVMGTSSRMQAVLCKTRLTLAEVGKLAPGDVVPLKGASLDGVSLIGTDGSRVVGARLGRSGAVRAVRLFLQGRPSGPPPLAEAMQLSTPPAGMSDLDPATALPDPALADLPGDLSKDPFAAAAPMPMAPELLEAERWLGLFEQFRAFS